MSIRIIIALIGLATVRTLPAADAYLGYVGPTLLRIATLPARAPKFIWPPLSPATRTIASSTNVPVPSDSVSNTPPVVASSPENRLVATNSEVAAFTNDAPAQLQNFSVLPDGSAPPGNQPVLITPELMAEYFRMNPGMIGGPFTNALPAGGLWFVPPVPRWPTESKASYRVQ